MAVIALVQVVSMLQKGFNKMSRQITQLNFDFLYLCTKCKYRTNSWLNQCPVCGNWHTFIEARKQKKTVVSTIESNGNLAVSIGKLKTNPLPRISTGFKSLDGALGGGIFPSAIVLLAGDPGVGKSTLLLQVCENVAIVEMPVLYVTGEESEPQVKLNSQRIGVENDNIFMMFDPEIERVVAEAVKLRVKLIIIDSIAMCYSESNGYARGSDAQMKNCAKISVAFGKANNVPIIIIGHVDKKKKIAGANFLQHLVDTVIWFKHIKGMHEGNDKKVVADLRYFQTEKNRFGSIVGEWRLQMTAEGLKDV